MKFMSENPKNSCFVDSNIWLYAMIKTSAPDSRQAKAMLKASQLRKQYSFSFWDSLIVASALHADTRIIYSEDMQDGLKVLDKVEIVNPFN
jgi:predicted nucleic acid-binding protein